jgi:hypothetical protein
VRQSPRYAWRPEWRKAIAIRTARRMTPTSIEEGNVHHQASATRDAQNAAQK